REVRGGPTGREAFRRRGGARGIPPGLRGGGPGVPRRAVRAGDGGARLDRKLHLAALSGARGSDPRVAPRDHDVMSHAGYCLFDTPLGQCGIAWRDDGPSVVRPAVTLLQLPEVTTERTESRMARASGAPGPSAPPPPIAEIIERRRPTSRIIRSWGTRNAGENPGRRGSADGAGTA